MLATAPWRFGPTRRQRRWALARHAGSAAVLAILCAYAQLRYGGGWVGGFFLGFATGVALFRHELRTALAPTLALGRGAIFLVARGAVVRIPWDAVTGVHAEAGGLELAWTDEAGEPARFTLTRAELALPAEAMVAILDVRRRDPAGRANLPADDELSAKLRGAPRSGPPAPPA